MNFIHELLRTRHVWYDRWHSSEHSNAVNWSIFLIIALFFTFGLVSISTNQMAFWDGGSQGAALSGAEKRAADSRAENAATERLLAVNNNALKRVNEHAMSAPGQETAALNLLRLSLTERQVAITELALTNPAEVRRFVFDEPTINSLPESVRDVAERPFKMKGTYRLYIAESDGEAFGEHSYEEYYLEVSDDERYRLALTDSEALLMEPESEVEVTGVELFTDLVIPTTLDSLDDDAEGEVLGASTIKKVAVVAFNFRNDTRQPISTDEIRRRVFTNSNSVAAYFKEVSYGQWEVQSRDRVDGDVYGWVTIDADAAGCNYSGWSTMARDALIAQGVNFTGYTNIQYVFPGSAGCSWAGIANLNGSNSWIRAEYLNTLVSGHELGHNFGFHHASTYGCAVANSTTGVCTPSEYADRHDIMGNGTARHTNNYNKSKYWVKPEQIQTITQPGTYTIEPIETSTTGTKVVRIKRPFAVGTAVFSDGYYHLEFRTPLGFDNYATTDPVVNGVTLRLVNGNYLSGGSKTYWVNTIAQGTTFTDTEGGITITPVSVSTAGITVAVDMPAIPCVRNNPTISITPSGQWGASGNSLTYTAVVKNNDTEGCGNSTFTVTPTLPTGFAQSPAVLEVPLNYGEQRSVSFQVASPLTAEPASYVFTQTIKNGTAADKIASASANFNIAAADVTPPTVSIVSPLASSTITARKETISVSASDTNGISLIEISIDGKKVKSCTSVTTCTYAWNMGKVTKGIHTILAAAVDNSVQKNRSETVINVVK